MVSNLPATGSSIMPWIIVAIVVLVAGAGLYVWSRRRSAGASGSGEPPVA